MVTIVSFSGRKNGNCSHIARVIQGIIQNANILSFSDIRIQPCGGCEYECFRARESCPYFSDPECDLLDTICKSEMVYFIVPNYCDHPNANFFIFNERSNCYFQGREDLLEQYLNVPKKFIVVSNSTSENFLEAFCQHTAAQPQILFLSAKKFGKQSTAGDLMASQQAKQQLAEFICESKIR